MVANTRNESAVKFDIKLNLIYIKNIRLIQKKNDEFKNNLSTS